MTAATLRRAALAMAAPKASWLGKRTRHYLSRAGLFHFGIAGLSYIFEKLAPPERRAMAEIAATADLLMVNDRTYLVAEVSPATLDAIAAFDAAAEDREIDDEDRCEAQEDDLEMPAWSNTGPDDEDEESDPPEDSDIDEDDDPKELDNEDGDPNEDREPDGSEFGNPMGGPSSMYPTLAQQLERRQQGGAS